MENSDACMPLVRHALRAALVRPDHLGLMSVDAGGKLTPRPERYTVSTHDKPNRVSTMVVVSPDEKFVFVGTTFDEPIVSTHAFA